MFKFTKEDIAPIARGLGIALLGATLTYVSQFVAKTNFGEWTPIIVAVWSVIVNATRKYIAD